LTLPARAALPARSWPPACSAQQTRAASAHLGSERDLHGVRQLVHAAEDGLAAFNAEAHILGGVAAGGLKQCGLAGCGRGRAAR
jgi:hypothetical protein